MFNNFKVAVIATQ